MDGGVMEKLEEIVALLLEELEGIPALSLIALGTMLVGEGYDRLDEAERAALNETFTRLGGLPSWLTPCRAGQ